MRRMLLLALSLALLAGALAGCGGSSDKDQITSLIKDYALHPTKLCTTYATPVMLRQQFGSKAACLSAASNPAARDPGIKVIAVVVKGDQATATRVSSQPKGFKSNIFLTKVRGRWKVAASLPAA